jgi:predicted MPP superfamily phosphohydrolase
VALPWYGALITFSKFGKKYESGLYRVGTTTLYVNRGLGLEPRPGPQVRFLARPEIAVFDILPE